MNPLTLVKRIQKLNSREADLGISEDASWHAKYKDSAYVFVGGIPYDLTEGDLLAIFAQYGELVDVNLVRDKATGKSKGFAFIAYEDQRSTNLAVDNLNGAQILGRTIRVDHVSRYKKKEEEDEEEERQKREERGVCRAFQRGECTRGAGCKFSHDEQRAANTGWGHEEDRKSRSRLGNDRFEGFGKPEKRPIDIPLGRDRESNSSARHEENDLDVGRSRRRDDESHQKHSEIDYKDRDGRDRSRQVEVKEKAFHKVERDTRGDERNPSRGLWESHADENYHRREEKRSRHHDMEEYRPRENQDERDRDRQRDREKRSSHARDSSSLRNRHKEDDDHHYRSRR